MNKCTWNRDKVGFEREVGCPLDHCPKGHHITECTDIGDVYHLHDDGKEHDECWATSDECTCAQEAENCPGPFHMCSACTAKCTCAPEVESIEVACENCQREFYAEEARQAERAAGWDPNP